jgi:drug/metabolite transporter (DMT)-like permease
MQKDNLSGILLMLAAMAFFAVEDLFLKWAAASVPVGQIILVSGLFGAPVFAMMAWARGARIFTTAAFQPAVLARNFGEMIGSYGYIVAIASVPLSTISAVLQAMPLAVTMVAALFMQAKVGWRRWSAIAVGFLGVLLVIRPGMDGFRPEALWGLLTVAGLTLRDLASRAIPPEVSNAQVSCWGLMSLTVLGVLMMLGEGAVSAPGLGQSMILLGGIVFGTAGYWAVTAASRRGEVSVVAPFRYARLIFAIAIGAIFFAEWPDMLTLCGAGLIVASGLYSFGRERRQSLAASR